MSWDFREMARWNCPSVYLICKLDSELLLLLAGPKKKKCLILLERASQAVGRNLGRRLWPGPRMSWAASQC